MTETLERTPYYADLPIALVIGALPAGLGPTPLVTALARCKPVKNDAPLFAAGLRPFPPLVEYTCCGALRQATYG